LLETLKNLGRHSLIYGLGGLANSVLTVILLPIYTRYLSPDEYGMLSLLLVTSTVAAVIMHLGMGSAAFREMGFVETDHDVVAGTMTVFLAVESAVVVGALCLLSAWFSRIIFENEAHASLLRMVFVTAGLGIFHMVITTRLRVQERPGLYSTLVLLRLVTGASLCIFFVVVLKRGVEGLIVAGLIHEVAFAVLYIVLLFPAFRMGLKPQVLKRMLSFGAPLVPAGLARLALASADRYILQHLSTAAQVGLYALGFNIGLAINLIVSAIQLAWPTQMFAIVKQPGAEQKLARIFTYYIAVVGFFGLALSVFAREAVMVLATPEYYAAAAVVPLLTLSNVFYGAMYMTNSALEVQSKMYCHGVAVAIAALLNIGLNLMLVPMGGMKGAALASVISFATLFALVTVFSLRLWRIPYEYGRVARIVAAWAIIYVASLAVRTSHVWFDILLKLVLLGTYPLLLWLGRFYTPAERARVREFVSNHVPKFKRTTV
jgi:O-antigen/teichoic acid export membrane protein